MPAKLHIIPLRPHETFIFSLPTSLFESQLSEFKYFLTLFMRTPHSLGCWITLNILKNKAAEEVLIVYLAEILYLCPLKIAKKFATILPIFP